jgi:hypothetical protein
MQQSVTTFESALEASRSPEFLNSLGTPLSSIYMLLLKNLWVGDESELHTHIVNIVLVILRTITREATESALLIPSTPMLVQYLHSTTKVGGKPLELMINSLTVILRNIVNHKDALPLFMDPITIHKLATNL